ncbi:MAG TPA: glycine oxidase ThiO, partial [Pseudomonas sp.]|nr:glycine oxidase ThiO [Pseudomonas sp.]
MKQRTIVVGGGVIGLLSAYGLAAAGCSVSLCEASATGTEASWA